MGALGKSIDLYLMDGTAAGRWQAVLSNWNCVSYKIPRRSINECEDIPELHSPGVYFLFGRDDESGKLFVYVGESDDALKRILQPHSFEKDGSYWTEAVVFITPDGTLEKGRIKYLENRFYGIAVETKRYIVKNGNKPPQSPVPKKIRDLLEEFIINSQLIMPALGHKVFEPRPSANITAEPARDEEVLYFSRNHDKGGKATGKLAEDGFWVLKDSYIYPEIAVYVGTGIKKARQEFAACIDSDGILQEDICFGSPSYAATFVCGKNVNGLSEWKNKDGVSLKTLNEGVSEKELPKNKETITDKKNITLDNYDNQEMLHLDSKIIKAYGYSKGKAFVVIKGSEISANIKKSLREGTNALRLKLIETEKIVNNTFTEDITFNSPSIAAACIVGYSVNGLIMWRNKDGRALKDIQ